MKGVCQRCTHLKPYAHQAAAVGQIASRRAAARCPPPPGPASALPLNYSLTLARAPRPGAVTHRRDDPARPPRTGLARARAETQG